MIARAVYAWHFCVGYIKFSPWRDTSYSAARYARLMTNATRRTK